MTVKFYFYLSHNAILKLTRSILYGIWNWAVIYQEKKAKCLMCVFLKILPLFSHSPSHSKFHWQRNGFINPSRSKHFKRLRMHIHEPTLSLYSLLEWSYLDDDRPTTTMRKRQKTGSLKLNVWWLISGKSKSDIMGSRAIRLTISLQIFLSNLYFVTWL